MLNTMRHKKERQTMVVMEKKYLLSLSHPTNCFVYRISFFSINYILYFFLTRCSQVIYLWKKGLNIQEMSIASAIPWIIGSVGIAIGGIFSDWLYRKTKNLLLARKLIIVGGLILSAICISFAGQVVSVTHAVMLMAMGIFLCISPLLLRGQSYPIIFRPIRLVASVVCPFTGKHFRNYCTHLNRFIVQYRQ
ncbi:hypothetical protein HVW88_11175 [Escherichia coli]|nr:hypothetical protein [Escherichia coli]